MSTLTSTPMPNANLTRTALRAHGFAVDRDRSNNLFGVRQVGYQTYRLDARTLDSGAVLLTLSLLIDGRLTRTVGNDRYCDTPCEVEAFVGEAAARIA